MNVKTRPAATGFILMGLLIVALLTTGSFQRMQSDSRHDGGLHGAQRAGTEKVSADLETDGIRIYRQFPGARLHRFTQIGESLYRALVVPEDVPINNSPWYAFRIQADSQRMIRLQLEYEEGTHRYRPKLSEDGQEWREIDPVRLQHHSRNGTATLELDIGPAPLYVSAQELWTPDDYSRWAETVSAHPYVQRDTVGYSVEDRPVERLTLDETAGEDPGVVILMARQHPPEVTGDMAFRSFMAELIGENPLARKFRRSFMVIAYPMVNPDGVANGHWRFNADGADLNRDWNHFHQPETRAIRDDLLALRDQQRQVWFGIDFHSTGRNKFYPIKRHIETFPDDFSYRWMDAIRAAHPGVEFGVDPFDTREKVAKNWLWRTFGSDGVTYEVDDAADRDTLREVARTSARLLMEQLLEKRQDS